MLLAIASDDAAKVWINVAGHRPVSVAPGRRLPQGLLQAGLQHGAGADRAGAGGVPLVGAIVSAGFVGGRPGNAEMPSTVRV
jgi:hypothetical protein